MSLTHDELMIICRRGIDNAKQELRDHGIPLVFCDKDSKIWFKLPDGSITDTNWYESMVIFKRNE